MNNSTDVERIESEVYRSRFDDGTIDIFVGLSLMWIGIAWMFLPSLSGLAGVLPAILVAPFVSWRTRFLEGRLGYVRFAPQRRKWERRNLLVAVAVGVALLVLGMVGYFVAASDLSLPDLLGTLAPGLIAFLLAAAAAGVAVITRTWRLWVIAAMLAVGGLLAAINDGNPGAPLIPAGLVAAVWGSAMLVSFVHEHPVPESR